VKFGSVLVAGLALSLLAGQASAQTVRARFAGIMDATFGAGAWRLTGGYRTPEREDELRAEGAMTVRPGGLSRHSLGSPDAPGAYDVVVDGMSPEEAARRLQLAGAPFARYQPKGAHGSQGPHLHLEPYAFDLEGGEGGSVVQAAAWGPPGSLPLIVEGVARVRPEAARRPAAPARGAAAEAPKEAPEFARVRAAALKDDPAAQLALGRAYAAGKSVKRDLKAAALWLDLAMSNPAADAETKAEANAALDGFAELAGAGGMTKVAAVSQAGDAR
jgi:hypothetical protein